MSSEVDSDVPQGFLYTKDHEWIKVNPSGSALVGITAYAARMLNDIVYVTLPPNGQNFSKHDVFGQVESVKTVSDLYIPVSGTVIKSNQDLTREPEVVASSPYSKGWMIEIEPSSYENDSKDLLDATSYRKYIQTLQQEDH
jgi:glycine cleavage system H protein